MKRLWEAHQLLVACSVISLVLLVGFSALQMHGSPILALNSQWVLVAGVPLMVALVAGGYIQKFKGFGLELESKLQAPVISLPLKVADAITYMPGSEKETISQLDSMSHNKIRSTKRLSFVIGKEHFYGFDAVKRYFSTLSELEFIEIKRQTGEFVCLIPISAFINGHTARLNYDFNDARVRRFITALEGGTILTEFADVCISTTVKQSDGLINVLERLRTNNSDCAVVVSNEGRFIGVVTARDIEKRIADDVLYTKKA